MNVKSGKTDECHLKGFRNRVIAVVVALKFEMKYSFLLEFCVTGLTSVVLRSRDCL